MADRDPEKDNLFKEIDEELRQESYAKLWEKYGNYLIGAAVLVVLIVASYQGWEHYKENKSSEDSALYEKALNALGEEKKEEALSILTRLTEDGSKGYAMLSRLTHAGLVGRTGDKSAADGAYLLIADDPNVSIVFRNLAIILSTMHNIDKGVSIKTTERIKKLTSASSAWRHTAKELLALIEKRNGNSNKANQLFQELADDVTAPASIRARAAEMSVISSK